MPGRDIIVIGASSGGIEALTQVLAGLPGDLPATLLIVQHIAPESPTFLANILERAGPLSVRFAQDRSALVRGAAYISPPDRHLVIAGEEIRVVRGPRENGHRPAADPLFRSAAWSFGPRVIGLVLSGNLDDGSAGLRAVQVCGGVAVVQDPVDAAYPDMPRNALLAVSSARRAPASRLGALLAKLVREVAPPWPAGCPKTLGLETRFSLGETEGMEDMKAFGKPSVFACPACRGPLWELHDEERLRYRCHTGHAYGAESLLAAQSDEVEAALYSALRALDENTAMARRASERYARSMPHQSLRMETKARDLEESALVLRRLLRGQERAGPAAQDQATDTPAQDEAIDTVGE